MVKKNETSKTESKEEIALKTEKVKEESTEEPVIVEKPIEVSDLSRTERLNLADDIKKQDIVEHLESEKNRIEAITCPVCRKKLGLKGEDYQNTDNKNEVVECSNCEQLVKVTVRYTGPIENTKAEISTKARGYAWETRNPGLWEDKHVLKYVKAEAVKLEENRSVLTEDEQKLFRVMLLLLKKAKVIK
ncbi:hypothetical protein [Methanobacterium spitsbergense]|uniref:Uncharacterized protein n=1 Tax=Methanobacterium spitsbergense TaxID=2874285 RepID=A0A8T5UZR6_9EURY|nr:hypothetical protein [Methanobacterium spitsbergense]MBZ2166303.1 hypothetical protein [Methanobacterium spitsbergense]